MWVVLVSAAQVGIIEPTPVKNGSCRKCAESKRRSNILVVSQQKCRIQGTHHANPPFYQAGTGSEEHLSTAITRGTRSVGHFCVCDRSAILATQTCQTLRIVSTCLHISPMTVECPAQRWEWQIDRMHVRRVYSRRRVPKLLRRLCTMHIIIRGNRSTLIPKYPELNH
ncbi:hypothetical protein OBBRIDRAFT_329088 [Obba rivulosa]|uniref:Uncharacterized protein n=1 Tax=Obba rivulosa TaxID=1052685 RepID=A0A8E2J2J2_9APHY|nr:hypothetical protein OBBRIDRAFT_329088 [Obba rivulosa]